MVRNLDLIVVVDIEATCWEGPIPAGEQSEIIEIGLCLLDVRSGERLQRESWLIRPEYSRVSPFCTALTTLTPADVEAGGAFSAACDCLRREYDTRHRLWASYGDYDRQQFEHDCQRKGVPYPFGRGHLNIKTLLALSLALPHEIGMAEALPRLGLPLEGTHHRGGDDAWNIAAILAALLRGYRHHAATVGQKT